MRSNNRKHNQLRDITIEPSVLVNAEGSCLIKCGNTHVICSATVENGVPSFMRGQNQGWITAEYNMLPRATLQRVRRESSTGKPSGRTQEIQRLIARSMRAAVDLRILGEKQIIVDCDVINADGGTRTLAITGGYVALHLAIRHMLRTRMISNNPLIAQVAAVSCGIYKGEAIVDLDYKEDSDAEIDANFVFNSNGNIVEIQGTAEKKCAFTDTELSLMLSLAKDATKTLFIKQNQVLLDL